MRRLGECVESFISMGNTKPIKNYFGLAVGCGDFFSIRSVSAYCRK